MSLEAATLPAKRPYTYEILLGDERRELGVGESDDSCDNNVLTRRSYVAKLHERSEDHDDSCVCLPHAGRF